MKSPISQICRRSPIFTIVFVVGTAQISRADAFCLAVPTEQSHSCSNTHTNKCRLYSSSSEDDELAKLIGKRNEIKRKIKEERPTDDDVFEAKTDGITIDEDSLNWDELPDFQAKRPVRQARTKEDEDESMKAYRSGGSSSNEPNYVDFLADYEDENDFHIPNRFGISTRCWGDEREGFVASGKLKKQQLREGKFVPGDVQLAYNNLLDEGILLFETSPDYGKAMSSKKLAAEDILARSIQEYKESTTTPLIVETFANKPWQRGTKALTSALSASCEKLEVSAVEVYQAKSIGWLPSGGIIKGMAEVVLDQGTANYVGVQNISPLRMRRLKSKLEKEGLTLTTNAFEFSLTDRKNEKWINACKTLGVIPLIRNPLGSGLASGQYTASNPSGGLASSGAAKFSFARLEKLQPLHSVLESVSERVKTRLTREVKDVQERNRGRKGPPVSL